MSPPWRPRSEVGDDDDDEPSRPERLGKKKKNFFSRDTSRSEVRNSRVKYHIPPQALSSNASLHRMSSSTRGAVAVAIAAAREPPIAAKKKPTKLKKLKKLKKPSADWRRYRAERVRLERRLARWSSRHETACVEFAAKSAHLEAKNQAKTLASRAPSPSPAPPCGPRTPRRGVFSPPLASPPSSLSPFTHATQDECVAAAFGGLAMPSKHTRQSFINAALDAVCLVPNLALETSDSGHRVHRRPQHSRFACANLALWRAQVATCLTLRDATSLALTCRHLQLVHRDRLRDCALDVLPRLARRCARKWTASVPPMPPHTGVPLSDLASVTSATMLVTTAGDRRVQSHRRSRISYYLLPRFAEKVGRPLHGRLSSSSREALLGPTSDTNLSGSAVIEPCGRCAALATPTTTTTMAVADNSGSAAAAPSGKTARSLTVSVAVAIVAADENLPSPTSSSSTEEDATRELWARYESPTCQVGDWLAPTLPGRCGDPASEAAPRVAAIAIRLLTYARHMRRAAILLRKREHAAAFSSWLETVGLKRWLA